jgi:predicted phage terminase large subunit-like protein
VSGLTKSELAAIAEIAIRRKARQSLEHFAVSVEIPGAPISEEDGTYKALESGMVLHHRVIMAAIQRTIERPRGRLMILAPPGSAKSTMALVAAAWAMGRYPGSRYIITSYASTIARKQSRKALQLASSALYRRIWPERPVLDRGGAEEWALTNGSELMAAGILAGITGNRANGIIIDDPIAGREEADSPTIQIKTGEAYRDDIRSRLLPGGWIILINTRWHESDLSGQILPEDYDGRTGVVRCQDGMDWEVLNIPAKAEREDDPLGRAIGEYLWPEWFPADHWREVELDPLSQRTWASLYQQRPTGEGIGDFKREWFRLYQPEELPKHLEFYIASDFAVSEKDHNDQTEHGVFGMDEKGDLWAVDWWGGKASTDVTIEAALDLVTKWSPVQWWDEGGVIDKAIRPAVERRMRERRSFVTLDSLPMIGDKRARAQSFRARSAAKTVHFPSEPWAMRVIDQLVGFPAARYDDAYDVCGLIGRGIDAMREGRDLRRPKEKPIKPFTQAWIEWSDRKSTGPRVR